MDKYRISYPNASFKLDLIVVIIVAIYFSISLFDAINMKKNVYDFILQAMEILTVSYVLVPLFLIVLVKNVSEKNLNNLYLLRYKKKNRYYNKMLQSIFFIVTKFVILVIGTIITLSIFSLDFKNEWSIFTKRYFEKSPLFLDYFSPLLYLINSLLLLWLFLLFLGFLYFILLVLSKSTAIALVGTIILVVANMAVTISKIEVLSRFFFTKHLNFSKYIDMVELTNSFSLIPLYLYWIILLVIVYIVGCKLIHILDLDLKKRS